MRLLLALAVSIFALPALAQETTAPVATTAPAPAQAPAPVAVESAPAAPAAPAVTAPVNTSIVIERASTMATPSALPVAGIFMLITNNGATDDKLIDVKSDLSETAAIHSMDVDDKGVMKMRPVKFIAIPAGKMTPLPPMGDHVMLIGLKNNKLFKDNESFPITLVFEKAGEVQTSVTALPPEEFMKRFPPEMAGPARMKADEIRAKLDTKSKDKTWAQRLRDRIRALGGQTSESVPPPPPVAAPENPTANIPAMTMPAPAASPAPAPDTSSAPTLTDDMTEEEATKLIEDHSQMDHSQAQ